MSKYQDYKNQFIRDNYDRITLTVPKGKRDEYKAIAENHGLKLNTVINMLLREWEQKNKSGGD